MAKEVRDSRTGRAFNGLMQPKWLLLLAALMAGAAAAQDSPPASSRAETVIWTVAPLAVPAHGRRAVVRLTAAVRDGWHVYAFKQSADGPTPLAVAVEPNEFATSAGVPNGSTPTIALEPAFGFATPYYTRNFTVAVPVKLVTASVGTIPLRVRYQSCDGTICEPPKTVHLSATAGGAGS